MYRLFKFWLDEALVIAGTVDAECAHSQVGIVEIMRTAAQYLKQCI